MDPVHKIVITGASEHNLKCVSLEIPKNKLIVVTGVSGSGKSSLIFDVLYREAENRYLNSLSFHARLFAGKMHKPDVENIEGLSPAISVQQRSATANQRSTVGTMTGLYDYLRILYSRFGHFDHDTGDKKINRSLFSFNSMEGACPACKGLGVEDRLVPDLLIADSNLTLRQGALVITAPNGYIIYSQVTLDVLDQVCRAEGFNIDIPWNQLTDAQKHIIFYGSDKIEIPFGKHPLESRMRWSGITARPREMGYYKGILPIMEAILQRDRNKNILRFVRTGKCSHCHGSRLNRTALSVKIGRYSIDDLSNMPLNTLSQVCSSLELSKLQKELAAPLIEKFTVRLKLMLDLGLSYLTLNRDSSSLTRGESQRLKLAVQSVTGLSGLIYIFDEPSVGLHPHDNMSLIRILQSLRDQGNTVIVVEHENTFIHHADWLIDIGPGPGKNGGRILQNIAVSKIDHLPVEILRKSRTLSFLKSIEKIPVPLSRRKGRGILKIEGACTFNLMNVDAEFLTGALNVVSGVSGAGKHALVHHTLANFLKHKFGKSYEASGNFKQINGWETIGKLIEIDQSPIGKTPRSNPATYTGLFDLIRDLFAKQPLSIEKGYEKSRFSFNTSGGRCESCQGAGYQQIGMHYMGTVEILCESCNGKRFDNETLAVTFQGKNIFEVLEMQVSTARAFFSGQERILHFLLTLEKLGLDYLTLGQRSSTLSGGEAQRVKLAAELISPSSAHTLYILDEPTTGLHQADVLVLIKALNDLVEQGHTLILIEHHLDMIAAADHLIDLGPASGSDGGRLVFSGTPEQLITCKNSFTADAYRDHLKSSGQIISGCQHSSITRQPEPGIHLTGVSTHNLKNLTVDIPNEKITVITGVSGSGKSSLAFDTLFAEGQNRFLESFSSYTRSHIGLKEKPDFEEVVGLTPTFAVDQRTISDNPRSTVGTTTGIYDLYRLLFSRIGKSPRQNPASSLFSFNHQQGACPACDGLGFRMSCDPEKLITNPEKSILKGAMDGTSNGKFYGDPFGQYIAILKSVEQVHGVDFSKPWNELSDHEKNLVLKGSGDKKYKVNWEFKRGSREGKHQFDGIWAGLINLVDEEYSRKHADRRGESMISLMQKITCDSCHGSRLRDEAMQYTIAGYNISTLSRLPVSNAIEYFRNLNQSLTGNSDSTLSEKLVQEILRKLEFLSCLGLPYISPDRVTSTLSAGESQRIKLAGQLGSRLTGLTYILDEPTIGLHSRDIAKLMTQIRQLRDAGNTVIIVEHNREVILAADHVIDMGPGAADLGGYILAAGNPEEIRNNPLSVTGPFLSGCTTNHRVRRILYPGIFIRNAFANNLKGFDIEIPSGGMIIITGVSGSGKSSLVFDVIQTSYLNGKPVGCSAIEGFDKFMEVIGIQPETSTVSTVSTPATYTGVFDRIREIFANTDQARDLKFSKKHFSFLNKEGRCQACAGTGQIRIAMDFLGDVSAPCEHCMGTRYSDEILACRYQDHSIHDILHLTIADAITFFSGEKKITEPLSMLENIGLGYLRLGQPMDTLSGGEYQRITLAAELIKPRQGTKLFLFEEPSTGLHFLDIRYLLRLFHRLTDEGHTLIIIEHDPDIISHADHIIELGPEGGDKGGYVTKVS